MFYVQGYLVIDRDRQARRFVRWDAGAIDGDATAVALVQSKAASLDGRAGGPIEGPTTERNHLASGLSTLFILRDVFADDALYSGDVPVRPALPDGAVG